MVAKIVCAFVSNNRIEQKELPSLITSVSSTLSGASSPAQDPEILIPAVPIKKSLTEEFIICLDDGKKFKSLKRHLRTLGLTPDEYRKRWGLPLDYPMVAPSYSAERSQLAKRAGLGNRASSTKAKKKPAKPAAPAKRTKSVSK